VAILDIQMLLQYNTAREILMIPCGNQMLLENPELNENL
jgi:hypothetical protein